MGSKLLIAETRTAHSIFLRTLSGTPLTRRERKHLVRTTSDLLRLVPMSVFVLIPFMEFLLPVALKIFPNMLPSTFQDQLKAEENMKRELKTRIAMAGFFQETLEELAKKKKQVATTRAKKRLENDDSAADGKQVTDDKSVVGATEFLAFLDAARSGKPLSNEAVIKFAKLFEDDLTLDKMGRMQVSKGGRCSHARICHPHSRTLTPPPPPQLVSMAKYMGIAPYGSDAFLRFQLRFKIRGLKEDDQRILWEGVHALTKMELMEACQERGMRSTGLSKVRRDEERRCYYTSPPTLTPCTLRRPSLPSFKPPPPPYSPPSGALDQLSAAVARPLRGQPGAHLAPHHVPHLFPQRHAGDSGVRVVLAPGHHLLHGQRRRERDRARRGDPRGGEEEH